MNAAIRLDQTTAAASPVVWVQVAKQGEFQGYVGGPFKFDRAVFDTIVDNFQQHPAYSGGQSDVVPWDFNHASEYAAADGTIPVNGAPAQGWVRELEVRQGASGSELWALTRWLEPARSYIKGGRYQWASVVVDFAARDAVTGAKLGPTLVSVAITNNPFIEGMTPLVAADRRAPRIAASNDRVIGTLRRAGSYSAASRVSCTAQLGGGVFDMPDTFKEMREHLRGMVGLNGQPLTDAELDERVMGLLDVLRTMGITELQRRSAAGPLILASAYGGRNRTEGVLRMLLSTKPETRRLDRDSLYAKAFDFVREHGDQVV